MTFGIGRRGALQAGELRCYRRGRWGVLRAQTHSLHTSIFRIGNLASLSAGSLARAVCLRSRQACDALHDSARADLSPLRHDGGRGRPTQVDHHATTVARPQSRAATRRERPSARLHRAPKLKAGTRDQVLHRARDEHFARLRGLRYPGADVDGDSAHLASDHLALAGVKPARTSRPSSFTASAIVQAQRIARAGPSKLAKKPSPAVSSSLP